jgi:transposase
MYIEIIKNRNSPPCILLRESYRSNGKVMKKTLANLTHLPPHILNKFKSVLGKKNKADLNDFDVIRSLPHGHVAAILGTIKKVGLDKIIFSKPSRKRSIILALIADRIINPTSKLNTIRNLSKETASSTLGKELEIENVAEKEVYAALDWIYARQSLIENSLAKMHLKDGVLLLYDVSSSYYEGETCPLARFGYNKDKKKGKLQIVYGLLCDIEGRPIAIEVFEGNTADPTTLESQIQKIKNRFKIHHLVMVGDRGIITETKIHEMIKPHSLDWISALRAPAIKELIKNGSIQPSLFDEKCLAEITSPNYPDERLIVCKNPFLAKERKKKREELLLATEKQLKKIFRAVTRDKRPLKGSANIGKKVGEVMNKYKMKKHFIFNIQNNAFEFKRDLKKIEEEAVLDGFYVIRSSILKKEIMNSEQLVESYKSLSKVENAFRCLKSIDLEIRPIYHRLANRVKAHVFLCMLAYYIVKHMRNALAPILFEDDDKEAAKKRRSCVVYPAKRSKRAERKAQTKYTETNIPVHSFHSLLADLGTITKNWLQPKINSIGVIEKMTKATQLQQTALDLLGIKI